MERPVVHNFYFLGQLWKNTPDGELENYCEANWKYCKKGPWVIPEEGMEGHVKIGHEHDEFGNQSYLRIDSEKGAYMSVCKECPESDTWMWERSTNKNGWFTLKDKSNGLFLTAFDTGGLGVRGKHLKFRCVFFHYFYLPFIQSL